jgi:alpha-glucosidase
MEKELRLESPGGRVTATLAVALGDDADARQGLWYEVSYDGTPVVERSELGVEFAAGPFDPEQMELQSVERTTGDETWTPVWGPTDSVRDHYAELELTVGERASDGRRFTVVCRAYDDGLAFRYRMPDQPAMDRFDLTAEETAFRFADPNRIWWFPVDESDHRTYELWYQESAPGQVGTTGTPATVEVTDDVYAAVHEAALVDYAGMSLAPLDGEGAFGADLAPRPDGVKVRAETPHASPWRAILLGKDPGALVESNLVRTLNEPCALEDPSWVDTGTYVGVWWEMHKGVATWEPGSDVGATTENTKRYVDFAADHDIPYVLAEGWNEGWAGWRDHAEGGYDGSEQEFSTAADHFDLEEVLAYCDERDVGYIAHNETGGHIPNFHDQLPEVFELYDRLGVAGVKTGYVGEIPGGHAQHDQWRVNRYREVVRHAADNELLVDQHEPVKPTGESRTYPNLVTAEGVRGMEFNAWSEGNPPEHTVTIPFTRMLAGPMDYTPGIFEVTWDPRDDGTRVPTTRARQLAYYPIFESGLQMAADLPEHYEGEPEFAFVESAPADWDETRVLNGEIGDYVTVARRSGEEWYVGSATDEDPRTLRVSLSFLDEGPYVAEVYADDADADRDANPTAVRIDEFLVDSTAVIPAAMAGGGGHAMRLVPADADDREQVPEYDRPTVTYRVNAPDDVATNQPFDVTVKAVAEGSTVTGRETAIEIRAGDDGSDDAAAGAEPAPEFLRVDPESPTWTHRRLSIDEPGTYEIRVGEARVETVVTG